MTVESLYFGRHDLGYLVESLDTDNPELAKYWRNRPMNQGIGNVFGVLPVGIYDRIIWATQGDIKPAGLEVASPLELAKMVSEKVGEEEISAALAIHAPFIDRAQPYSISIYGSETYPIRKLVSYVLQSKPPFDALLFVALDVNWEDSPIARELSRPLYQGKISEVMVRAAVDAVMSGRNG